MSSGLRFRFQGFWFRVSGSVFRVPGLGCEVSFFGFGYWDFGFGVCSLEVWVWGSGFQYSGSPGKGGAGGEFQRCFADHRTPCGAGEGIFLLRFLCARAPLPHLPLFFPLLPLLNEVLGIRVPGVWIRGEGSGFMGCGCGFRG